ncbi:hypothetical protein DITRI_Ditri20bG0039200 [Diplodiscus trichospermus]
MRNCTKLLVLVVLIITLSQIDFALGEEEYRVHISNGLSNNNELTIHCQSKDDDLGEHRIPVSQEWNWSFKVNQSGTTLFWCNMNWANHHGSFEIFVVDHELLKRCDFKECFWSARDDGLYLENNSDGSWLLVYRWEG